MQDLWKLGYSPQDIISTVFRVTSNYEMAEKTKLDFMKEIGQAHLRILEGTDSLLQLTALVARLCRMRLPKPIRI